MNTKNIFRVHHKDHFLIGPYNFMEHIKNIPSYSSMYVSLCDILLPKEPWNCEYKHKRHLLDNLYKSDHINKFGNFSSFKMRRPGLFEDPILKDWVIKNKLNRHLINENKLVKYFCFSDEQQMNKWFDSNELQKLISDFPFEISKVKEPKNKVIIGYRQAIVLN